MTFTRVVAIVLAFAFCEIELVVGGCTSRPSATISQGTVKGARDTSGNSVYLGIPFAATTGGDNR